MCSRVGRGFSDNGWRPPQLAACGGKAPLVNRGDEGSQLIQRDPVQHIHLLSRYIVSKYIVFSDGPPVAKLPSTDHHGGPNEHLLTHHHSQPPRLRFHPSPY